MAEASHLITAILRLARLEADPEAYLSGLSVEAARAVLAGDVFVTSLTGEGGSSSHLRGIPAADLVELLEVCLIRLQQEEDNGGPLPDTGNLVYLDHSSRPVNFG